MNATRGDLADVSLAERLFAPHYVAASVRTAVSPTAVQNADGTAVSELLMGEPFEVLELTAERAWGRCSVDGAVGFVDPAALGAFVSATHIVRTTALSSGALHLPMGTRLAGTERDGALHVADDCFSLDQVQPVDAPASDMVAVAEALVGTRWAEGGRSGAGVDASGLVFLTLSLAGIAAPRFGDLQAKSLGRSLSNEETTRRGDLIFLSDHGGIALNGEYMIHATVRSGVVCEPLADAIQQIGAVTARRRLA